MGESAMDCHRQRWWWRHLSWRPW